jgi:hypothetical protein
VVEEVGVAVEEVGVAVEEVGVVVALEAERSKPQPLGG